MNRDPNWKELLARLESDLQSQNEPTNARTRDETAWKELEMVIRGYAEKLGQAQYPHVSTDDVRDMVQGILLKLQSPENFRKLLLAHSTKGYLIVMIRHAIVDIQRQKQREIKSLRLFSQETELHTGQELQELAVDQVARLEEELARLPQEERELLQMRFWERLTIEQMAKRQGISYSATAVRLFRLLHRLRERLGTC